MSYPRPGASSSAAQGLWLGYTELACARSVFSHGAICRGAPCPADFVTAADPLRLAVAAYLARLSGSSRDHAYSDLRCFLVWCAQRGLDPLTARRVHQELYIRWMQEVRRFKPSTVSRRFSVAAGFYRTAVIDGVLEHSPAEYVRRPAVPPESPTLGFTHLQFEAISATRS
jgi:integrase/recombinase XerD